jgi:hypothetical protein
VKLRLERRFFFLATVFVLLLVFGFEEAFVLDFDPVFLTNLYFPDARTCTR